MAITTMYLRMKTENGGTSYRNIAPNNSSKKLNFDTTWITQPEEVVDVASAFVPIQTEEPALTADGKFQIKFVHEETVELSPVSESATVPGTDGWSDTTDEKLLVNFTDGDNNYRIKVAKAATAQLGTGSLATAVQRYAAQIAGKYQTADTDQATTWVEAYLTGTKEELVARNS